MKMPEMPPKGFANGLADGAQKNKVSIMLTARSNISIIGSSKFVKQAIVRE
jgi:hypothetical protein